jgi:hypothetical protein
MTDLITKRQAKIMDLKRYKRINNTMRSDNKTGVKGVYPSYRDGICRGYYVAWFDVNGKKKSVYYGIVKHGSKAFEKAVNHRKYIEQNVSHYREVLAYSYNNNHTPLQHDKYQA